MSRACSWITSATPPSGKILPSFSDDIGGRTLLEFEEFRSKNYAYDLEIFTTTSGVCSKTMTTMMMRPRERWPEVIFVRSSKHTAWRAPVDATVHSVPTEHVNQVVQEQVKYRVIDQPGAESLRRQVKHP